VSACHLQKVWQNVVKVQIQRPASWFLLSIRACKSIRSEFGTLLAQYIQTRHFSPG